MADIKTLRSAFETLGFETSDDPYQPRGFLVHRAVDGKGEVHKTIFVTNMGCGEERVFLARGDSLNTGYGHSMLKGLAEVLRFATGEEL